MKKAILILMIIILTGCSEPKKENVLDEMITEPVIIDLDNTNINDLEYTEVMLMYIDNYSVLSLIVTNKNELPINIKYIFIRLFDENDTLLAQKEASVQETLESEDKYSVIITFDGDLTKVTRAEYYLWEGTSLTEFTNCEIGTKC